MSSKEKLRAAALGQPGWQEIGSAQNHHKYAQPTKSRRKCHCCGGKITHNGMANGLALTSGCQLYVRRWMKGLV